MNHLSRHDIILETERLKFRPCSDPDLDVALPFYHEPEFLNAMEGEPPDVSAENERSIALWRACALCAGSMMERRWILGLQELSLSFVLKGVVIK